MNEGDLDWLEAILPGLNAKTASSKHRVASYKEDSFLLELLDPSELKRVLLPFSRLRIVWDALTLALVVYTALILPYLLAFTTVDQPTPTWMRVLDVLADGVFVLDIFINFNTAIICFFYFNRWLLC